MKFVASSHRKAFFFPTRSTFFLPAIKPIPPNRFLSLTECQEKQRKKNHRQIHRERLDRTGVPGDRSRRRCEVEEGLPPILTALEVLDNSIRLAYIMQEDRLFPALTVCETLMFAADLRLGPVSTADKKQRVEKLIQQLGLTFARNTFIGDEGTRGVSGDERRRVSIGVDIIHGSLILFLDEPTSGLDSTSAHSVIEKVHHIARSGPFQAES